MRYRIAELLASILLGSIGFFLISRVTENYWTWFFAITCLIAGNNVGRNK